MVENKIQAYLSNNQERFEYISPFNLNQKVSFLFNRKHTKKGNIGSATFSQNTYPIYKNMNKKAKVRIFHASIDAPNINVYLNQKNTVSNLAYKVEGEYISILPGHYQIDITPVDNLIQILLTKEFIVEEGKIYTIVLYGTLQHLSLISFYNHPEVPEGESKIRFMHFASNYSLLDVAVKERDVIFPNILYKNVTEYLGLTPMTVDLEVRTARSKNVVLHMPKLQFQPNKVYTIILTDGKSEQMEKVVLTE